MRIYKDGNEYFETFQVGDFVKVPLTVDCSMRGGYVRHVWTGPTDEPIELEIEWTTRPFGTTREYASRITLDARADIYEQRLRPVPRPPAPLPALRTREELEVEVATLRGRIAELEAELAQSRGKQ